MSAKRTGLYLAVLISAAAYASLAYLVDRTDFRLLLFVYLLLFAAFLFLYHFYAATHKKLLLSVSVLFRLVFLLSVPVLSNDYTRFIWDGRLMLEGINPFMFLPEELAGSRLQEVIDPENVLYPAMGSLQPGNYTCYPPLNQLVFWLASCFDNNSILMNIVWMRLFIILTDIGLIWIGMKILRMLGLSASAILLYALNPLVIIELSGNLHFEGFMLFLLLLAFYLLFLERWKLSALFFAFSVSVKLIPLLLLPLLFKKLGIKKFGIYTFLVILVNVVLFLPFLSEGLLANFWSSIDLYFRKFEFNASLYYIVRAIGYEAVGWNIIQKAGPYMALIVFLAAMLFAFLADNKNPGKLIRSSMFLLSIYYFMATTVMPWYILSILVFGIFTQYRYSLLWTFSVILSYYAYSQPEWKENLWVIFMEYLPVYTLLIFELLNRRTNKFV
ncbi:MAG: mannosyltransferase [Bacteroidota bacterium]|nr:mannosyltransferase [Bacteroidota bacterium]